jgi:type I restriction enzyme, S subunit
VGVIPEDWEVKLLPDVLHFISGKAHEQHITLHGQYIAVNSKFISSDGVVAKFSDRNFCPAKLGDILTVMSDLPNGRALAKCFLVPEDDRYTVNQRVCILRSKGGNSGYFKYILNRNPYFMAFDDGVQQTHLLNGMFAACPLPVPPTVAEQSAIAEALSDVDRGIAAVEAVIAKKRALKTATMQALLSGTRRLPGFSGEWEVKALDKICPMQRGFDLPTIQIRAGSVPVVYSNGVSAYHDKAMAKAPGIVTGRSGTIGNVHYVEQDFWPHNTSLWVTSFCGNDPKFVLYFLRKLDLARFASGSGVPTLNRNDFHSFQVKIPKPDEQIAIAAILSDIDSDLAATDSKLTRLRHLKTGMMQQLLTGKIRLV